MTSEPRKRLDVPNQGQIDWSTGTLEKPSRAKKCPEPYVQLVACDRQAQKGVETGEGLGGRPSTMNAKLI